MKLVVTIDKEKEEYEINKKKDLIDVIKDYVIAYLPEDDDYAFDMFKKGNYNDLIDDLKLYQIDNLKAFDLKHNNQKMTEELKNKYNSINSIFLLLGDIEKNNDFNQIINRLTEFNILFKNTGFDIMFII